MNFFSLPSSLHGFFFLAFSFALIFFWFFPHPHHHFSNGPSLTWIRANSVTGCSGVYTAGSVQILDQSQHLNDFFYVSVVISYR